MATTATSTQKIPSTWAFWSTDYNAHRCIVCGREAGGRSFVSVSAEDNATMVVDGDQRLPVGKRCAASIPARFLVR